MSNFCQTCEGYTLPWCHHGQTEPPGPCDGIVLVPLVADDTEGEVNHAFPCLKRTGHSGLHLAHVEWGDLGDG